MDLSATASDLTGDTFTILAENVAIELLSSSVPAGGSSDINVTVSLPEDMPLGRYSGLITFPSVAIEIPVEVIVTDGDNEPPVITNLSATPSLVTRLDDLTLTVENVVDPDGAVKHVDFFHHAVFLGRDADGTDGWSFVVNAAGWSLGDHTVSAIARDDRNAFSDPIGVVVTVENLAPLAHGDDYLATEGQTLSVQASAGVLANDDDPDGDVLCVILVTPVKYGALELDCDGGFSYTPGTLFNREDVFQYYVEDGTKQSGVVSVVITVESTYPWYNGAHSWDVSDDGYLSPLDALLVVNSINAEGGRTLPMQRQRPLTAPFLDVNRDGLVSPLDALLIINRLNQQAGGEGECSQLDDVTVSVPPPGPLPDVSPIAPTFLSESHTDIQPCFLLDRSASAAMLVDQPFADRIELGAILPRRTNADQLARFCVNDELELTLRDLAEDIAENWWDSEVRLKLS